MRSEARARGKPEIRFRLSNQNARTVKGSGVLSFLIDETHRRGKDRILVADDYSIFRDSLRQLLVTQEDFVMVAEVKDRKEAPIR